MFSKFQNHSDLDVEFDILQQNLLNMKLSTINIMRYQCNNFEI